MDELEYSVPIGEAYFQGRTVSFREGTICGQDHLLETLQPGMASDVAVGSNWVGGGWFIRWMVQKSPTTTWYGAKTL